MPRKKKPTGPPMPADLPVHEAPLDPKLNAPPDDDDVDSTGPEPTMVYLTFITFLGDVLKTAQALNIEPSEVKAMAEEHGWFKKVERLNELRTKEGGSAALAREINRTVNYVQAVRLRNVIDRAIRHVTKNKQRFREFMRQYGKYSSNVSAKACLELVKSVESVHRMTYAALGDSVSERLDNQDGKGTIQGAAEEVLQALSDIRHSEKEPKQLDSPAPGAKLDDEEE